ncbi:MAG TPA: hypothetical protein VI112_08365 [Bacteroidia bacterium]
MRRTIIWLTLFAIAMGFLETAVVIYLRRMFYPNGFGFPLATVDTQIALVEFCREAATIIMLVGIGALAGKNPSQRFAFFIYAFAIWDIFYYVFLKIFLGWPESLFTWDILFLIPVPWVGPVIAPVLVSCTMILLASLILYFDEETGDAKFRFIERLFLVFGCLIAIISFVWDYFAYVSDHTGISMWAPGRSQDLFMELADYSPGHYNWWMFLVAEAVALFGIFIYYKRLTGKRIPKRAY